MWMYRKMTKTSWMEKKIKCTKRNKENWQNEFREEI